MDSPRPFRMFEMWMTPERCFELQSGRTLRSSLPKHRLKAAYSSSDSA